MQVSYIYILNFPKVRGVKIGKADDFFQRYRQLVAHWGEADLEQSYILEYEAKNIFNAERKFHHIFADYKLDLPAKDGYTEFFSDKILNFHIPNYLKTASKVALKVTKGIELDPEKLYCITDRVERAELTEELEGADIDFDLAELKQVYGERLYRKMYQAQALLLDNFKNEIARLTSELEFYKKEHSNISELKLELKECKMKLELQQEQTLFYKNLLET